MAWEVPLRFQAFRDVACVHYGSPPADRDWQGLMLGISDAYNVHELRPQQIIVDSLFMRWGSGEGGISRGLHDRQEHGKQRLHVSHSVPVSHNNLTTSPTPHNDARATSTNSAEALIRNTKAMTGMQIARFVLLDFPCGLQGKVSVWRIS